MRKLQDVVGSIIGDCNLCNRNKSLRWKQYKTLPVSSVVGEFIHIDIFGQSGLKASQGMTCVLVVVERLSGFIILGGMKGKR